MANNRLYILDTETGEKVMIAKSMGRGWQSKDVFLEEWFSGRDLEASCGNCYEYSNTKLKLVCENDAIEQETIKRKIPSND